MPQDDPVSKALAGAKATLSHANAAFPSSMAAKAAPAAAPKPSVPAKPAAPAKPATGVGAELKAKAENIDQYTKSLPKMHVGGPVMADGGYQLKAGEHVLTAKEAGLARKHALLASGIKSLAQEGPVKKAAKPAVKDIKVRPEKNQGTKISVKKS